MFIHQESRAPFQLDDFEWTAGGLFVSTSAMDGVLKERISGFANMAGFAKRLMTAVPKRPKKMLSEEARKKKRW